MKKIILSALCALSLSAVSATASTKFYVNELGQVFTKPGDGRAELKMAGETHNSKSITIVNEKSPEFLLGKETHINMKFVADDNPDMWLKAGVRVQGTFSQKTTKKTGVADAKEFDAYLRRVRFEVAAGFNKYTSFVMDIRNDKANYEDKGEEQFNVGDAYLKISKPFHTSLVNFKLYRGKIDVSRTETVKSARVIHYDRPKVADEAAQYITHNRRGTNAQMYGDWKKKIHYEVAFGDGVYSGKLKDATGASFPGAGSLTQESFFYGGKVVLSPFDGWEETSRTESYFAQGKHFEVGAAYWKSPDIGYNDGTITQKIDHDLKNFEISAHYKGLFAQAEYFDFNGVVKQWGLADIGKSKGWYATSEYVIEQLQYLAPFVRYEKWNKYNDDADYDFTSKMAGVNWYLRGNTTKVGLTYQEDKFAKNIGNKKENILKVTTQWFF